MVELVNEDQLQEDRRKHRPYQLQDMENAVREWAVLAQPFTRTGDNGVFKRRAELPPSLREESRASLERMLTELEEQGRIVLCVPVGGKSKKRYDVPDGPIASGILKVVPGSGKNPA